MLPASMVNTSLISGFESRAELALEITENIEKSISEGKIVKAVTELLKHNDDQIQVWLYAMLYVNFKQSDYFDFRVSREQRTIRTKSDEQRANYIVLYPRVYVARGYFGFLNKCENSYKRVLYQLLNDGITELYYYLIGAASQSPRNDEMDELLYKCEEYVKKINFSEEDKPIEFIQNIEMVYSIGKEIGGEQGVNIGENFRLFEKMQSIYQVVREELQKRDRYYASMGIITNFAHDFTRKLHTMIFLEPDEVFNDNAILNNFIECYTRIYRSAVSVDKN